MECTISFRLRGVSPPCLLAQTVRSSFLGLLALLAGSSPSLAASPNQAPPLAAGMARVWFLHDLVPGSTFFAPMISANGAKVAISPEGSAFYRDYVPGNYLFSVENCVPQPRTSQQLTLAPNQEIALHVQSDDTG